MLWDLKSTHFKTAKFEKHGFIVLFLKKNLSANLHKWHHLSSNCIYSSTLLFNLPGFLEQASLFVTWCFVVDLHSFQNQLITYSWPAFLPLPPQKILSNPPNQMHFKYPKQLFRLYICTSVKVCCPVIPVKECSISWTFPKETLQNVSVLSTYNIFMNFS